MRALFRQPASLAGSLLLLTALALAACTMGAPIATPTHNPAPSATATATPRPSATVTRTHFRPAAPTATRTPSPTTTPPPIFDPTSLRNGIKPESYLDACQYLHLRWDPNNSPPGTIVVPIMYHSIAQPGRPITANTTITEAYFQQTLQHARALGFQTITTSQLVDFLEHNAKIPQRSLLMIVDDRRPGVVGMFMPYLKQFDWTLTLAWISGKNTASNWKEIEDLAASGRLDVQSHGYNHVYIYPDTPLDVIEEELTKPMDLLLQHFGKRPIAYIWPGGDFLDYAVAMARSAGYQIGFTAFSRGPVMFNWVPQGAPEQAVGDPLMLLPRFWSTAAYANLDEAVQMGEQAAAQARQDRDTELAWMNANCPQPTATLLPPPAAIASQISTAAPASTATETVTPSPVAQPTRESTP